MKDESAGAAIKEFVRLKLKMYLCLVNDDSEHKKAKGLNKSTIEKIGHRECKYVLLNKKCLRHSIIRIQSKIYKIETYETKKKFFCLVLMRKYVSQTMDMADELLVLRVSYEKTVILVTIQNSYFVKLY